MTLVPKAAVLVGASGQAVMPSDVFTHRRYWSVDVARLVLKSDGTLRSAVDEASYGEVLHDPGVYL